MNAQERRMALMAKQRRQILLDKQSQLGSEEPDEVTDAMPEWLDTGDRSVVKNLANSPEESLKYLQGKYPDAEIKANGDDILLRKKGEQAYGRLDPSFSPISNPMGTIKDLWNDTKDLAYDGAQAGAEAAGTAAGALAGLGAGSLPAAMAGGALGAGAASTAKEFLRKHYGLTDEVSAGNIATDAALGGLMPGAFHVAGKGLSYGAKKVAPKMYSMATGLSVDALKKVADGAGDRSNIDIQNIIRDTRQVLSDTVDSRKNALKEGFLAKRGSGARVGIDPVIKQLDDAIAAAKQRRMRSGANILSEEEKTLQAMKDRIWARNYNGEAVTTRPVTSSRSVGTTDPGYDEVIDPLMGGTRKIDKYVSPSDLISGKSGSNGGSVIREYGAPQYEHLSGDLDVSDAMDVKEAIKNAYIDYSDDIGGKLGKGNTVSVQEERAALEQVKKLDDAIYGGDEAGQMLKRDYGDLIDEASYLNRKFKTDEQAMHTLRNLRKGKNKILKANTDKLDKTAKDKLIDAMNELELQDFFDDSMEGNYIKKGADTLMGKSPLSKALTAVGGGVGATFGGYRAGIAGGAAGRFIGDALTSPENVKRIARFAKKKGMSVETAMKAIADDPKLMGLIYGTTYSATNK